MRRFAWAVLIGIVVIVILALGASLLLAWWGHGLGFGIVRPGMMGRFGYPFFFLPGLGMMLFWVLLIVGVVWLIRSAASGVGGASGSVVGSETPLDILKRRYAKGEITKEQYEEMKNALGA